MQKFHLTRAGLDKFKRELEELKRQRPEIAETIASAREQGDLSENASYQSAKEEQDLLETRIDEIGNILKNVTLINTGQRRSSTMVGLGSTVHLQDLTTNDEVIFSIVGTMEADPSEHKISDESLVGRSLIGKQVGAEVCLPAIAGESTYKITAIK